jgi:Flp pilus assembly pilin Flp
MRVRFKNIRLLQRFFKNDRGGTIAELAILIPFLAVMLAAVTEIGRFFQTYTTVSKSTRTAARYLSNHAYTVDEQNKAKNLVVCGKLAECAESERFVKNLSAANVCIESVGNPVEIVTVRIPREAGDCGAPVPYTPIFDIGALLHNSFSMEFPISAGTTMWHRD